MAYLLDTNAWIDYLKQPAGAVRRHLAQLHPADVLLCSVVKSELWHGAEKYGNRQQRLNVLARLFAAHQSLPFDDNAAATYAMIRHDLEVRGLVIGPYDLQIAAICMANQLTLVTRNTAEFTRIPSLSIVDWSI